MKRKTRKQGFVRWVISSVSLMLVSVSAFADKLANALGGEVAGTLGSDAMFWKIFILVDIVLATAAAVKTKNPMVFPGVASVSFIPGFLLKTFVFGG